MGVRGDLSVANGRGKERAIHDAWNHPREREATKRFTKRCHLLENLIVNNS